MLRIFSVDPGLSPAVAVALLSGYDFQLHFAQAKQRQHTILNNLEG